MRALTLQQANLTPGVQQQQQQHATCGRSLTSNYSPPSLENKFLAQTSVMMPQPSSPLTDFAAQPSSCPSLQPSRLSSTSSSLLSTPSFAASLTSPLLSTQNKLLASKSPHLSLSLSSSVPNDSLLSTSLASGSLLNPFAQTSSFLRHDLMGGKEKRGDGGDPDDKYEICEVIPSNSEEPSMQLPEGENREADETDAEKTMEMPALETEFVDQELEQTAVIRQEEFGEVERGNEMAEELKDKKYFLLNIVCCSLVNKSTAPGQKDWDSEDSVWTKIINLGKDISAYDPEFLLKVAVYARQKLNIRITANFLLALAANLPPTKPHVRRYFCVAVQLPSDWLEVVRIYSTCFSRSLPMCLKKAMADKFKQFNEYQLAKYNTRKHRCKHNRSKRKIKKPTDSQLKKWADLLRSDASILKKFLQVEGSKVVVDKKQSEFSMKKLIKRLHIKEPAEHVMAILGKKYPADMKTFTHSGMKGVWDRERAGQRMKLKEPQTWERLLSMEGNKAATWEKLIDTKSLPFMAMLRNLRNMITVGISEAHHKKIISRLTNEKAVIQSRQFPLRFLAAYKVIMELYTTASAEQQALPSGKKILMDILKKIPKSRRLSNMTWEKTPKSRIRLTLGVPFISGLYSMRKAQLIKAVQRNYTVALLDRYRKALETAVQISCHYNVPPLPGRTLILLPSDIYNNEYWNQKQDFCLPPDPEEQDNEEQEAEIPKRRQRSKTNVEEVNKFAQTKLEVAALLALMISSSAEDCELYISRYCQWEEVKLKSDVLLENVRSVIKQIKNPPTSPGGEEDISHFHRVLNKANKVSNIIVLSDSWVNSDILWAVRNYKREVNSNALVVYIFLSESGSSEDTPDRNHVVLTGFSEQILRFVAERGSSRLLDHVEHLDKLYNIPPPEGAKCPQTTSNVVSIPASPKLRWQGVRVFISSTFRDMHSERDILVRSVFPELRRRAAPHCLYLQEVELRWGVTEEESERAAELCLSEVCRSQMLVGILGERYGQVPPKPDLPDLPQYSWLASAPAGLSITEMELRQFQALYPDVVQQRMFCYFRDPNIIRSVPVAWRSDFSPESKDSEHKMASLKRRLLASDVKVTENYSCEWGGVVDGKPYLKNLEDFGKGVLEDLWMAVKKLFIDESEEAEEAEVASEMLEQEVHQGAMQRQFFGRSKLLCSAVDLVEQARTKGGMIVVEGGPGEGKTVFMAALADALRTGVKSRKSLVYDVISYSTAASQSAHSVENLLRCLVKWLRKMKGTEEESPLPHSYKDLLSEFHSTLSNMKSTKPLVLLVDGVDIVQDGRGQISSDWIPQQVSQGVCLVVSITSKTALSQTLAKKKGAVLFTLGQLTMLDRKEIVQKELDAFGKKLSESAFNNQLQTLISKKGAISPLYLHMACDDLRNFASFDKLKDSLQDLPQSLSQLVQYSLERLCSQYRGMLGLRWALAALTISTTGLKERDLYSVLNTCNDLSSCDGQVTWQEVLQLSRKPKGRIPMATFTRIVQSLQSLIGPSHCHDTDDVLALTNPEVKRAFEDFLLPAESDRTRAHLVLAAHLWTLADPQGRDTFLHCEANSVMHLPSSLIQSGQLDALYFLLSSYYFLYANVRHGFLHHLLEMYSLYDKKQVSAPSFEFQGDLEDCHRFLQRHASTLSSWPALFIQQALSEPLETSAHIWAKGMVGKGGVRVIECLNKDGNKIGQGMSELLSTFPSEPTSLVMSPDNQMMVVGTKQGTLHFIHMQTGQEVKSLMSSCDGISSCVFLKDGHLATTSFDGQIEVWDTGNGCRTALIDGHTNTITASDVTADKKYLATVSLDFMLKVWSSNKGNEVASMLVRCPMNCVTFDPEGHLLAAGCWNGNVIMWNWLQNKKLTSLCGHTRSVHSLSFSPHSSMLCSGSVSGEVRVWSVPTSTCVGCFQAHCGATEALTFLEEGSMLLSAGSDHTLQLWSGGLGRSVTVLKSEEWEQEPPQKKLKGVTSEPPALCVAVNGDHAAVGYHGDGIKLFSLGSGEKIWASRDLDVSVSCMLWVTLEVEQIEAELLVSGGSDKCLRVWKRKQDEEGVMEGLEMTSVFGVQSGTILALAQNSTYLATASDDFTIGLWLLTDLAHDAPIQPNSIVRGHSGGVTCLAFSPDGAQLLSGGKDQALMVWDVSSSPAVLSKALPHAHRDWITGCVWTPDCVISSSNDGRLCLWDLKAGQCLREISWTSPLTSVCCLGQHVIASCAEGALHVWKWETNTEICHISSHMKRIHHCSLLPHTDGEKEAKSEEMSVFTASDDGTVRLWKPLQVEHISTFQGHSGAIQGVVCKQRVPQFLTVSEDGSLRCWTWTTEIPPNLKGSVTALHFCQKDDVLLAGYESGLLELWQNSTVVGHMQASEGPIAAVCSMPDSRIAVAFINNIVIDVWKLVWNKQHNAASLVKVTNYKVKQPVTRLFYCTTLIGVTKTGEMFDVAKMHTDDIWLPTVNNWLQGPYVLGVIHNDVKSVWLVGESNGEVHMGFFFIMGSEEYLSSGFCSKNIICSEQVEENKKRSLITSVIVDKEFVVCGDAEGNMWFNRPPEVSSWSNRKPAHSDRISVLRLTDSTIISASYDRTVKLWDRNTKKQVGMFVCGGPVLILEVNPQRPTELVCSDGRGNLYFLSWRE
ncbi:telomerase protein component 1 [Archocentrus centrarchus]|uniref:telomerase protein component 1 n=1 Tax=Archocentrus centrarchus TaxID=63155 RepID=UPI0011E9B9BF|nr:telomerase protein component 1 [Archocentrus centrarchus]XP_030607194.1 telomerase protein component 1 [Archocentrus centrarchus]